jgi:hypothetical protein
MWPYEENVIIISYEKDDLKRKMKGKKSIVSAGSVLTLGFSSSAQRHSAISLKMEINFF